MGGVPWQMVEATEPVGLGDGDVPSGVPAGCSVEGDTAATGGAIHCKAIRSRTAVSGPLTVTSVRPMKLPFPRIVDGVAGENSVARKPLPSPPRSRSTSCFDQCDVSSVECHV